MPTFINKYIIFIKCVTTSVLIYLTIILCEVCNNLQTHNNRVLMRLTLKHSNKTNMKWKVNSGNLNHHPLKKVIKFCSLSFYPHGSCISAYQPPPTIFCCPITGQTNKLPPDWRAGYLALYYPSQNETKQLQCVRWYSSFFRLPWKFFKKIFASLLLSLRANLDPGWLAESCRWVWLQFLSGPTRNQPKYYTITHT